MGGVLPPPQRPPNARERKIIDLIRAYAASATTPEQMRDVLEGLRNIAVDSEAIWEQHLDDTKNAGSSWGDLEVSTGTAFGTLQTRLRERRARRIAEQPRVSNGRESRADRKAYRERVAAARQNMKDAGNAATG